MRSFASIGVDLRFISYIFQSLPFTWNTLCSLTPVNLEKPPLIQPLPLMTDFADAEALYAAEKDPFYLAAFLIQHWLGGLLLTAAAEYAEKKNPKERSLQSGQAWRSFADLFNLTEDKRCCYLLGCMLRFSVAEKSTANSLRRALVPLSIEHRRPGESSGLKRIQTDIIAKQDDDLARRTITRWCDWLDAAVHLRTHQRWHTAPAIFDPDPQVRELAALGNAQRHLAHLSERARTCWLIDFAAACDRYKNSPKWAALGKAMAAASSPNGGRSGEGDVWTYEQLDTLVLSLWPLVKQHNWTYRDLLSVIRPVLKRPKAYPCERDQDFATYCVNVLGLRKAGKGVTARNGKPTGYEIARQLITGPSDGVAAAR